MPFLYPVACLNFFLMYWSYKALMVKYYRKTVSFNEDLPVYSIKFLKLGIVLHTFMGAFILSNDDIINTSFSKKFFLEQGDEPPSFGNKASSPIAILYFVFVGSIAATYVAGKWLKIAFGVAYRCAIRCIKCMYLPCTCVYECLKKICGCFCCICNCLIKCFKKKDV